MLRRYILWYKTRLANLSYNIRMSELIRCESLANLRADEKALEAMQKKEIPRHLGKVAIFEQIEFDPVKYPPQRMDVIGLRGQLASADVLQVIGSVAFGETYTKYAGQFEAAEQTLASVSDGIDNGEKFLFLTTHERTDDIAAAFGAFASELQKYRIRNSADRSPLHTQILISKLITGMGALGSYVPNLLADNLGDVLLTIPPSRSVRSSEISRDGRVNYNKEIKKLMREDSARYKNLGEGLIRAVAANGSTFVNTPRFFGKNRNAPRLHAAPLAMGTVDMMRDHKILPVAVHITGKNPGLKIHALRDAVTERDEAHDIMDMLINDMTELSGVNHKYYRSRDEFEDSITYKVKGKTLPINTRHIE